MIESRHIVIFGFGAQGSAQARNLRAAPHPHGVSLRATEGSEAIPRNHSLQEIASSAPPPRNDKPKFSEVPLSLPYPPYNLSVCLKPKSPRIADVKKAKIPLITDAKKAAEKADIAVMLVSDGLQPKLWKEIEPHLPKNTAVIFAHGFNIHYRQIVPRADLDIILIAPLAHAATLRNDFVAGKGTPCLIAISQDATGNAKGIAMEYAHAIARDGPFIESTFAEETETDLFTEQTLLCGGFFELIRAAFDTLVEKGYNPDIAYHCTLKEVRPLANLVHEHGIAGARERISDTALYGDLTRGPRVIDNHVRGEMKKILEEIRSGEFKNELLSDRKNGNPLLRSRLEQDKEHLIERIHKKYSKETK